MAYSVPRSVVDAFYSAYAARDIGRIADFLHDDVEWTISGPIDLLTFCGIHRGKAAVIDLLAHQVPRVLRIFSFVPETILVEGDQLAMVNRQSSRHPGDGRAISFRVANFMRFRDHKVIRNLSLIDTFDAVEQVLGHPLAVADREPAREQEREDDLIAV